MPTLAELSELRTGCTWTWTTQNGVNGYLVTSNKDGFTDRSIFLPAAGYHAEADLWDAGSHGYYWSSSLTENTRTAYCLIIQLEGVYRSSFDRGKGISVRPVCP
ncbi:MAG: hypothetical protein IJR64_03520 [Bacteroidales bacterium]|nr:hypothetical protein [Bacteroidales bacterium]